MDVEVIKDYKEYIIIRGARAHNLKNINVEIPKNKLVVITGVSGSGKSSLAFDTLYAEGQRRYVESLSAYARQFMGRMSKPEVDYIKGIAPAIAIEQKVITSNPRSTVGTSTEIYDYLKLLFSRIGKTISPVSNREVKKHTVTNVVDFIATLPTNTVVTILCPFYPHPNRSLKEELAILLQKGFSRMWIKGTISKIEDVLESQTVVSYSDEIKIIVDRVTVIKNEETNSRIADSVQTAFFEGRGDCIIEENDIKHLFCNRFELDGIRFEEPSPNFFSFNNSYGACNRCEGFGKVIGIDPDLVIPDKSKSIYDGAVAPWRSEKMKEWLNDLIQNATKLNFPIHRPYNQLNAEQKELLWLGNKHCKGLNGFFDELEQQTHKIQYRVMLSRYRGKTICPDCRGSRLRKDASYVKVGGKSISEIVWMPLDVALDFFQKLQLSENEQKISKRLLIEVINRIQFLNDVGLRYLTLNRLSNTLSGGESQRINLATSLGSSLIGSIYVLDEPSIGLHPRDTQRLIKTLKSLRDAGNSVVIVEHEEEIMRAADYIIDIGPEAGIHGGELVFKGTFDQILKNKHSLTGRYLSGEEKIKIPENRRKWHDFIEIKGVIENNLKNIDVKFPLHAFTVISGVSGSGKTSLVKRVLYPAVQKAIGAYSGEQTGAYDSIGGDLEQIKQIEMIDQNPIGRSSRSNPATYVGAWDEIRHLFASQASAKAMGLRPAAFSTNIEGGRCDICLGEGVVKIEMQFMADIYLPCEACEGKRFKQHILDISYKEKNVYEVLEMTVSEALMFFSLESKIVSKLRSLADVGLSYIHLGHSSSTLSGGEAQRIKLASFLIKGNSTKKVLFIFDEPTTGLHFHDIKKLLNSFNTLLEQGHTILVIEHNMDVIKCADWVIDIGPEGGEKGGTIVFEGLPEDLIKNENSYTGKFLKQHMKFSE